jgi:hypothetical protein
MQTRAISAPQFRYIGITDECITCQKCGKPELKSTVVLAILDTDGNAEEFTYYGSTCAARALAVRGGGRAVLSAAKWAQYKTAEQAKFARKQLAFYGLPETGTPGAAVLALAAARYAECNARWAEGRTFGEWEAAVLGMLGRRQGEIADAVLVGA